MKKNVKKSQKVSNIVGKMIVLSVIVVLFAAATVTAYFYLKSETAIINTETSIAEDVPAAPVVENSDDLSDVEAILDDVNLDDESDIEQISSELESF